MCNSRCSQYPNCNKANNMSHHFIQAADWQWILVKQRFIYEAAVEEEISFAELKRGGRRQRTTALLAVTLE